MRLRLKYVLAVAAAVLGCGETDGAAPLLLGVPSTECRPATCASVGAACGAVVDGCGAVLDCGPCAPRLPSRADLPEGCAATPPAQDPAVPATFGPAVVIAPQSERDERFTAALGQGGDVVVLEGAIPQAEQLRSYSPEGFLRWSTAAGESGQVRGPLVAQDLGRVLVWDQKGPVVRRFGPATGDWEEVAISSNPESRVEGEVLAVDRALNMLVQLGEPSGGRRVALYTRDGTQRWSFDAASGAFAPDGNVVVVVSLPQRVHVGTRALEPGHYVLKLSADTGELLWSRSFGVDYVGSLTVDVAEDGAVVVGGTFSGSLSWGGVSLDQSETVGGYPTWSGFVATMGADGCPRWARKTRSLLVRAGADGQVVTAEPDREGRQIWLSVFSATGARTHHGVVASSDSVDLASLDVGAEGILLAGGYTGTARFSEHVSTANGRDGFALRFSGSLATP